jgi:hypothetical protein
MHAWAGALAPVVIVAMSRTLVYMRNLPSAQELATGGDNALLERKTIAPVVPSFP